jgi:hypothetical protein
MAKGLGSSTSTSIMVERAAALAWSWRVYQKTPLTAAWKTQTNTKVELSDPGAMYPRPTSEGQTNGQGKESA